MGFFELFGVVLLFMFLFGGGIFLSIFFIKKSCPYFRSYFKYKVLKKKYESSYIKILDLIKQKVQQEKEEKEKEKEESEKSNEEDKSQEETENKEEELSDIDLFSELLISGVNMKKAKDIVFINRELKKKMQKQEEEKKKPEKTPKSKKVKKKKSLKIKPKFLKKLKGGKK